MRIRHQKAVGGMGLYMWRRGLPRQTKASGGWLRAIHVVNVVVRRPGGLISLSDVLSHSLSLFNSLTLLFSLSPSLSPSRFLSLPRSLYFSLSLTLFLSLSLSLTLSLFLYESRLESTPGWKPSMRGTRVEKGGGPPVGGPARPNEASLTRSRVAGREP